MSLSFQERDLAKLGIHADVESDLPGYVTVTLTNDDFDRLCAQHSDADIEAARDEGFDSGEEYGRERGHAAGYDQALADLRTLAREQRK